MVSSSIRSAQAFVSRGEFDQAIRVLAHLDPSDPAYLEGLLLRGVSYIRTRRKAEAKADFSLLLAREPDHFEALTWMAVLNANPYEVKEALPYAQRALALRPDDASANAALGECYIALRQPEEAIAAYSRAVELAPDLAEYHHNLGTAYQMARRNPEAVAEFRKAIALAPTAVQTYLVLGSHYALYGIAGEAIEVFRQGLRHVPRSWALHNAIASAYASIRNDEAAAKHFQQATALSPQAKVGYSSWLINQGRFEEADVIHAEMLKERVNRGRGYYGMMQSRKTVSPDFLAEMEGALAEPEIPPASVMFLSYALGKAYEGAKDFGKAAEHYDRANAYAYDLHSGGYVFNPADLKTEHARVVETYERLPGCPMPEKPGPIFIVGMIRSGTTLMEQIVSSHPQVAAAGELRFWMEEGARLSLGTGEPPVSTLEALAREYEEYTQLIAGPAERITDKMPLNYRFLGLIHRVIPNARFIHVRRHPVDTCLSIYTTYFGKGPEFAYKKANIVAYYRQYLEIMNYWRWVLPPDVLLEVDYADLLSSPEEVILRIIAFCDLPWDEACLHHDQNTQPINTPSRWQARQPLYKTSMERWKNYEPYLGEFGSLLTH